MTILRDRLKADGAALAHFFFLFPSGERNLSSVLGREEGQAVGLYARVAGQSRIRQVQASQACRADEASFRGDFGGFLSPWLAQTTATGR